MNLRPLPETFAETRDALHQIAFFALGPVRYQAVGRMGLQAAPGGFGTPRFDGRIARVEGDTLVLEEPDRIASQTITTVRAAAGFFGIDYRVDWFDGEFHDPLDPVDPDAPLPVDDPAARALGQWFGFGTEVLERLRSRGNDDDDVSEVQLWPEHFDPATEMGDADLGQRASYGASPGDGAHHEPYLFVAAWSEVHRSDPYWNDDAFNGASLGFSELLASSDPVETGVEFLFEGYRILHST
ncbi:MAG TPA: hypothetical protein VMP13_09615 [Acidimicrobiia bacterium]|nr:hypothetical protein [Acidimicrobiia bacterium]